MIFSYNLKSAKIWCSSTIYRSVHDIYIQGHTYYALADLYKDVYQREQKSWIEMDSFAHVHSKHILIQTTWLEEMKWNFAWHAIDKWQTDSYSMAALSDIFTPD